MAVLLDRTHPLPGGPRVRLRLARPGDRADLHELLERLGLEAEDIDVRRALRCTPGHALSICATAWDGSRERLVGIGTLSLSGRRHTLLAEDRRVARLLAHGLGEHAGTWARRVA